MNLVYGLLNILIWGVMCALIVVLYRIAHFFQATSGRRSYYQWFSVPLGLILLSAVRYASLGIFVGDPLADSLILLGGLSLIALGYYLLRLMTGGRS
jgi:hypothetical protein